MSSHALSPWLAQRRAGILLHPTSLPGPLKHGDLGHGAYRFVEFAAAAGFTIWQVLPLGPTHEDGSPYQCLSAHAGNPLLISLDWLRDRGWLTLPDQPGGDGAFRRLALTEAFDNFARQADATWQAKLADFSAEQAHWLDDYVLFIALRGEQGNRPWMYWPADLRHRDKKALAAARRRLAKEIEQIRFEQFIFFTQWSELKAYAAQHDILLFGDMPIFVAQDSTDVWACRELFEVDIEGKPQRVAGVPPDFFSETGQLWGNPLYDWQAMAKDGFAWWVERMRTHLLLFDMVRIDHFRGLEAFWAIPADAETALSGAWEKAPGEALLERLHDAFHQLPVIAEDLGFITPEVHALRRQFGLPGMLILQFGFDGDSNNIYLSHNHEPNMVVYTATHDNDTTLGWYQSLTPETQRYVDEYLGGSREQMPWPMIRTALRSVATLAVLPMQDILELGEGHRMNVPGTCEGNWGWRFDWSQLPTNLVDRMHGLIRLYGRLGGAA